MDLDTSSATTFGSRLAAARRARDMTQEELGQGLAFDGTDLGKAAVSKWETDRSQPTAAQLRAICQRLNVSANDLLGLEMPWDGVDRREHPQT